MANIVLEDKECPFRELLEIVENSLSALLEWRKLARALGTELVRVHTFVKDLRLNLSREVDVIEEILVEWRSRIGNNATLGSLLMIVEKQCKWPDIADSLRNLIKKKAVAWDDLDERSKQDVYECPVKFLGRTTTLLKISKVLGLDNLNEILQSFLKDDLLKGMLDKTSFPLDNIQKADQLPYYIPRTLTLQRQLNQKIFKKECKDIFVVQGMQRSHLSRLVSPERTDLSGNQLERINLRFIILECDKDFEILRKIAQNPIHRISFESGKIFWISTVGSMAVIRDNLMASAEEISESQMVKQKLSIYNSRPIAIADCPGMGKTRLLEQIASQVAQHYPERYVLTIYLPKLFSTMKCRREEMSNLTLVKRSLASSSSSSLLGQKILFELMNSEETKFEVFLDAFDEISSSQLESAERMLKVLLQSNNLRAIITTRTYMRDHLEQTVGVVSWNILPFTISDQTNFFIRYWTIKIEHRDNIRLQKFSGQFMKYIQSHQIFCGKDDAKDFVGIPIKCFVLAQLYLMEALRYVTNYSPNPEISFKFSTLGGMYQAFFKFRLKKIPEKQKVAVKEAHWVAAIQLLFPSSSPKLKELLPESVSSSVDTKQLLSVGILNDLDPPKFVHRTFAEYLVADFIFSHPLKKQSESGGTKFVEFLFHSVLAFPTPTYGVQLSDNSSNLTSRQNFEDFASFLESLVVWSQLDAEFKNPAGVLETEGLYCKNRWGMERIEILRFLLQDWSIKNGNSATYSQLIYLLRSNGWPSDIIDELENIPSALQIEYQHPAIVYFIDALLFFQVETVRFDDVVIGIIPYLQNFFQNKSLSLQSSAWLFENFTRCATRGHLSLLKTLIGISAYPNISFQSDSHDWASLVITSTRHQVSFFEALSQFVESLYGKDLTQLDFGRLDYTDFPYTPLHEAVIHGNYAVVEYLVSNYGTNLISTSKELVYRAVENSVKESPPAVSQRMDIIRLLVESSVESIIDEAVIISVNEKLVYSTAITAGSINVNLFKFLIELGADPSENFNTDMFVDGVLPSYTPEDVDHLVEHKTTLELLFRKNSEGVSGLEKCIFCNNLRPRALQKIYEGQNFSLKDFAEKGRFLGWIAKSKWQPEMVKTTLEILNNVDLCDENNCTLLIWAAVEKALVNIRYLISAGENVNHISADGWSPLSATVYVLENEFCDPSLIHECIQVLLAAGADVNVRDFNGNTMLDKLESQNWKVDLQQETIDLLITSANGKYFCNQNGKIIGKSVP